MLYESYIHPLTILSTLLSAGVGALATLMLFGFDRSLIALIGVILLIGIVKKNGIMLVDFAMTAERDQHLSSHDAIRQAALLRFRPILMTTMAAILGGLIVSQALTLFTTTVIYLYLDQLQSWLTRKLSRQRLGRPKPRTLAFARRMHPIRAMGTPPLRPNPHP